MTSVPGLYSLGECNFSDHGANRLGANSLLQASIDGYFVLPSTISNYLADISPCGDEIIKHVEFDKAQKDVKDKIQKLLSNKGHKTVNEFHIELGKIMWQECAISRNAKGLIRAIEKIDKISQDFHKNVKVGGHESELNQELEKALRLSDFIELAKLMCRDALSREESCGAHFREEFQTTEGEALRVDENFSYVSAWEFNHGDSKLNKEPLHFEYIKPINRSYK
jgi:succinate dehydrogenase / fumarate reductase flavoprotein subunit